MSCCCSYIVDTWNPCSCECGCASTTSTSTTTTTTCAGQPCDVVMDPNCIIYNGPDIPCYGINTGDTAADILQIIINNFACITTTTDPFAVCLNVNPTFDANLNGWTTGGDSLWVWSSNYGGCATYTGSDAGGTISQDILTIGKTYLITLNYTIVDTPLNGPTFTVYAGTSAIGFNTIGTHFESFALTCIGNTYLTVNGFIESGYEPGIKEINLHDICVIEVPCYTYLLNN